MRILLLPAFIAFSVAALAQRHDPTPAVPPTGTSTETNVTGAAQSGNKPIALRIVGSNVKNLKGEYLGRIDDVALNPESKQIEFALVDMAYPTNNTLVTPVPWQSLNYVWDQGQVGGTPGAVQLFRLDVDKGRLAQAPKIDRKQIAELLQPQFRQQLLAFYGGASEYAGATGSASTETSGGASGGAASSSTTATPSGANGATTATTGVGATPFVSGTPGFIFLAPNDTNGSDTNRVLFVTNVVQNSNTFVSTTNVIVTTNFVGRRNRAGTNNTMAGGPAQPQAFIPTNSDTNTFLPPTGRTNVTFTRPAQQQNQTQTTVPGTGAPVQRPPNSPWGVPPNIPPAPTQPANGSASQPSSTTPDILPPATPSRPGSVFQPPNPAPAPPPAPQRPIR